MNLSEQIINHLYLLTFIAILFILCAFLSQKTDKDFIVKIGLVLVLSFIVVAFNLLSYLIG